MDTDFVNIFKIEDEPPLSTVVEATEQISGQRPDSVQPHNTPSVMSLQDFSDTETLPAASVVPVAGSVRGPYGRCCRDCTERHRKCSHIATNVGHHQVQPVASYEVVEPHIESYEPQTAEAVASLDDLQGTTSSTPRVETLSNDQQEPALPATAEDAPEVIDITLWTQRTPVTVSPQQPSASFQQRYSQDTHDADSFIHDEGSSQFHQRRASSDSSQSNTSIPYYVGDRAEDAIEQIDRRPLSANETITLQPNTVGTSNKRKPREVRIWEGSEELHEFPTNLRRQLNTVCAQKRTNVPDCVRSQWPGPKDIFSAGVNKTAKFIDPGTGDELLMARYHYGSNLQIIVVKQKKGTSINGGQAAIVNFVPSDQTQFIINGRQIVTHIWAVWDPLHDLPHPQHVRRVMEGPNPTGKKVAGFTSMVTKQPSILPENHQKASSVSDTVSSKRYLRGDDEPDEIESVQKKPRHSYINLQEHTSKLWPRRGSCEYIVVDRVSDGMTVRLACPKCSRHDFSTVTGIGNHCRLFHDMDVGNNNEVANVCGIPPFKGSKSESRKHEKTRSTSTVNTPVTRRETAQAYATPAPGSGPATHEEGPIFIFKRSDVDLKPRIRPLKVCNSAEKLFVNAVVAGVAKKDSLMLTVQVGDEEPINVMRGDAEDFNTVLQAIDDAGSEDGLVVTVTAEDFDV